MVCPTRPVPHGGVGSLHFTPDLYVVPDGFLRSSHTTGPHVIVLNLLDPRSSSGNLGDSGVGETLCLPLRAVYDTGVRRDRGE